VNLLGNDGCTCMHGIAHSGNMIRKNAVKPKYLLMVKRQLKNAVKPKYLLMVKRQLKVDNTTV
jgi:hypothetical protein